MPFPIDAALPALLGALAVQPRAVLVAPPGAGKTTRVPLALLDAPWLPSLRDLRLKYTDLSDAGVTALARCAGLSRLRVLDLGQQPISAAGAESLAASPHLGRPLRLNLSARGPAARPAFTTGLQASS